MSPIANEEIHISNGQITTHFFPDLTESHDMKVIGRKKINT